MSFWNKSLAAIALTLTLAFPAMADGTPGQRVNRGPEPVRAHQPVPPEPGCYLIEDGKAWSCPARPAKAQPVPTRTAKPCCGTTTRTIVKEHPPVVTKRMVTHRSAPAQRTVARRAVTTRRTPTAPVTNDVQLDMASFSGGVGSGVSGGYYGGGGAILISSGRSYSGVLSHGASNFTFRSRHSRRRGGGGGGCGCMGGGD